MNLNKTSRLVANSSESMALQQYTRNSSMANKKNCVFLRLYKGAPRTGYALLYSFCCVYIEAAISKHNSLGDYKFGRVIQERVFCDEYLEGFIFGILRYFDTVTLFLLFVFK